MKVTLEELMAQQSWYESDKYCAVCHGKLETALYAVDMSYDGRADWFAGIKVYDKTKNKTLKRCARCGLVYAK
jgi:ribosomal protein L37E